MTWIKEARAACDDDKHEHLIVAQEMRRAYLRHALDALEKAEALAKILSERVNFPEDAEVQDAIAAFREAMK